MDNSKAELKHASYTVISVTFTQLSESAGMLRPTAARAQLGVRGGMCARRERGGHVILPGTCTAVCSVARGGYARLANTRILRTTHALRFG